MTDPIKQLERELVNAADRRAASTVTRGRIRRRLPLLTAGICVTVAAPAMAIATGVISLGGGATPDGSTYEITQSRSEETGTARSCTTTSFRAMDGQLIGTSSGCGPQAVAAPSPHLSIAFMAAPGETQLITGSASLDVARVHVVGAAEPRLVVVAGSSARAFAVVLDRDQEIDVTAFDASGKVLQRVVKPSVHNRG
jgi:hypothetical protein